AYLAGLIGVHFDNVPTGACCLEENHVNELSPSSITDRFVESRFGTGTVGKVFPVLVLFWLWTFHQIFRLQVLKHDVLMGSYQLLGLLGMEVSPLVPDFVMCLCHGLACFLTAVRAAFLSRQGLLKLRKFLLCFAKVSW